MQIRKLLISAALIIPMSVAAQSLTSVEPFKVGTFSIEGAQSVGIVLRDSLIVDLDAANAALETNAMYAHVPMPADMLELIGRYEYGLKPRMYEIVNALVENNALAGRSRAPYVHDLEDVGTLPPILYPGKILNAAVNFYTHVNEAGSMDQIREARRQRRVNRGVPYLFLKPSRGAVIGDGDPIELPYGRTQIDWEVELGTVMGRAAKYVSAEDAQDYIFGYMVSLDISDRGGRPPGGAPFDLDWYVGKGHDTFAPQGPWIVPKEFYGDPMENLRQTLSVDGEQMQEAQAGDMIHSLYELIEYASSVTTLYPGDVINNGTSGGTGAGTYIRGEQRFLQPGEEVVATIDGIGTLRLPVVAGPQPDGGTGAALPPVDSYSP